MDSSLERIGKNGADLYVHYLIAAEQAVLRGEFNNAKVFRALAYSHRTVAMNAYRATEETFSAADAYRESIVSETEIRHIMDAFGMQDEHIVTQQSAIAAKACNALDESVDVPEWIVAQFVYTCTNCGYIVEGQKPEVCPTCSALGSEFQGFGPFFASDAEHLGQQAPDSVQAILVRTAEEIAEITANVDHSILAKKPSPTEWSVKEIIGHILETDALFIRRIDSILTGAGYEQPVPPWKLHEGKHYNKWHRDDLIGCLIGTRKATINRIRNLTPKEWATASFMLGGNRSVLDTGTWIANHDRGHLEQIKRLSVSPGRSAHHGDMKVTERKARDSDYDFLWHLKVASMQQYIEEVYGWNEEGQENYFRRSFNPQEIHVIQVDRKDVGMYVYDADDNGEYLLKRIEVLPEYQGKGIGGFIIDQLIHSAKKEDRDLRLHVFKINPARQLYSRLGFEVVHETETHYVMRVQNQTDAGDGKTRA